ncbi:MULTISPECIES: TatA/E family twin arginine-targeting protein translocase [Acaryochloris]|uniref:Sec-independent protein translocase protein TatA n=1 Tax=Acaryochloris marina (strain MBIC 11017) TaxID=329726 RepID=B0CDZ3_ACAM1|nr:MULTISPECIES: TatA/E family twin arginine-targeting protein translocase [Acaryochloris]ABW30467.1 twin-arginine translocation protein TatA/E family [Acaryochloris marina MBIC11017]KAI9132567.1 TatA/E family twin arginine-targeting protein translocase [Acaryochloris sp. CCMEE 5410]BDM79277.1 hypothetical protein AM10699_21450 [Acaryochloris marina MBIC10699]
MNVFGIGLPEMALIMVIALLVFGPKKLPEIGRSMGKALKSFQEASKEFENEFKKEADRINETLNETPMEATLETPKPQEQPQLEGQEMAEAPTDDVMAESPEVTNS